MPPSAAALWWAYLAQPSAPADAEGRLYGVMKVGGCTASTDAGARLILREIKTATSSLEAEFVGAKRSPRAGDLSIVLDGGDCAVCIVGTTEADHRCFDSINAAFARDCGEWDRTPATWRRECGRDYARLGRDLGIVRSRDVVLICKRFRVAFVAPET